jgi:hypothetical protein
MTRRDNIDFRTPSDSTLRGDLTERTRIGNAFTPDLFISVHHNADAGGAHDKNETQTYYKLGDEGASLDAAASIHRFLKRNLGIRGQRILPGNYFVLRNSDAPAVLTEASYITNPDVESRLALVDKRRLEAEALYLGIAHYFARGAPVLDAFEARGEDGRPDTSFTEVDGPVWWAASAELRPDRSDARRRARRNRAPRPHGGVAPARSAHRRPARSPAPRRAGGHGWSRERAWPSDWRGSLRVSKPPHGRTDPRLDGPARRAPRPCGHAEPGPAKLRVVASRAG